MILLLLRCVFDPAIAVPLGALLAGRPEFAPTLERIVQRESLGRIIGAHEDDAARSREVWGRAVAVGWIDPACQPHELRAWSTRGIAGMMAAYSVHHLPGRCWSPWVLDVPLVSAWVATKRGTARRCREVRACRAWIGL